MNLTRLLDRAGLIYLPLALYGLFTLVPFYSMVVLSLHSGGSATGAFTFLPFPITWAHFDALINGAGFGTYVRNSFVVAVGTVACAVPIAILTGYGLCRYRLRGRHVFMLVLLTTQFVPAAMLIIPLFIIFKQLGLLDTLLGLVLVNSTFELPLTAILMRGFISGIPFELEEAAMVDGCTRFQSVVRIVLPLLRPGIVAVASFAFVGAWNNFLFALFLINNQDLYTVPVGLSYFLGEYNVDYAALAAGGVIAVLPVVLIFVLIQRYLVGGLSVGAVKG
ncbi:MAG TPA: carbohydrate ABC transporter permease [Terriglobales bacterium]|nr:carbohydrate ABC transporter permease [Terriglobales bacterium]